MKINNIMCCKLTQLALEKEYNKIWEQQKMQLIINATINKVFKRARELDANVIRNDVVSGVYIRLRELIDKYNPITKNGDCIEFFPYIYKIFSTYSFNVYYFVDTFKGAEFKSWKNGGNEQIHRIFYIVSEQRLQNETDESYLDRMVGEDTNSEDPIENVLNEEIDKEINNLSKFGQTLIRTVLNTKTITEATNITGIRISSALLDIQRHLKDKRKRKKCKEGTVLYDLDVYKQIFKLMLIKNNIDINKYEYMLN